MSRETTDGWVYVVTNPAFPGWVKIGWTVNLRRRLARYQTYDPARDYRYERSVPCRLARLVEQTAHDRMDNLGFPRSSEWFQASVSDADGAIRWAMRKVSTSD